MKNFSKRVIYVVIELKKNLSNRVICSNKAKYDILYGCVVDLSTEKRLTSYIHIHLMLYNVVKLDPHQNRTSNQYTSFKGI